MTEMSAQFGPDRSLLGIYEDAGGAIPLCCLLINSGVIPRVGPNRLNVKIARELRLRGVPSMRFDLSGLGDSRPAARAATFDDQAALDIGAAMDFVERLGGPSRFVIFGICSGAVNAMRGALNDARIVGVLMLDGFWYRVPYKSELARLWKRFRSRPVGATLRAFLRRLLPARAAAAPGESVADLFAVNGNPPRQEFARDMNAIAARGVDIFFLYTGSVPEQVSYAGQMRDAFHAEPFARQMRCELHDDLDHTAVPLAAQRKLLGIICEWIDRVARRHAAPGSRA
jgi:hypothetical protein